MSEQDAADLFSRAVDERLAGRTAEFSQDAEALRLAARLAGADFAADSAVRSSLRAALVTRSRRRSRRLPAFAAAPAWALAAAVVFLAPLSLLRRSARTPIQGLPVLSGSFAPFAEANSEPLFERIAGGPFATAAGREERAPGVRAVVFDLEGGGSYRLETRSTSLTEIFGRPAR